MPLPGSYLNRVGPITQTRYGVALGFVPSTQEDVEIELQRKTTGSTFTLVHTFNPDGAGGGFQFRDLLPNDNVTRVYRARHVGFGGDASAWSGEISARPTLLLPQLEPVGEEGRRRIDTFYSTDKVFLGDVGVASSGTLLVTTSTGGSDNRRKTFKFGHTAFQADSTASRLTFVNNSVRPSVVGGGDKLAFATFPIAPGVTIRQVRCAVARESSNATMEIQFFRVSSGSTAFTTLWTRDTTERGWFVAASSSMAHTVSTQNNYGFRYRMVSATTGHARGGWCEVHYDMPSYDKSL